MKRIAILLLLSFSLNAMEEEIKHDVVELHQSGNACFDYLPIEIRAHILSFIPQEIKRLLFVNSEFRDLVKADMFLKNLAETLISRDLKKALDIFKFTMKHSNMTLADTFYKAFASRIEESCSEDDISFIIKMVKLNLPATVRIFYMAASEGNIELIRIFLAVKSNCELNPHNELNKIFWKESYLAQQLSLARAFFYHAGIEIEEAQYGERPEDVSGVIRAMLPLDIAAAHHHKQIVILMLENGAVVNFNAKGKKWYSTVLHMAAKRGDKEMSELFLDHGARIDDVDSNGLRPLTIAAGEGHFNVVQLLLERNAYVHDKNRNDMTALMQASQNGHFEIVQLLLKYGANPIAQNCDGKTAEMLAIENGHNEVVSLIRSILPKPVNSSKTCLIS